MATLIPTTQTTGVEAYEDMFKEITRKLYGEETGHGLHTLGTPMAHVATTGPTLPEGERSFTTLMADRSLTTIEYENNASETNNTFKTEDHITTAFGLAALMQNGFPPPSAISHNFQASAASRNGNNFMVNDERWPANAEECLPWNANKNASYNCQKSSAKHKTREFADGGAGEAAGGPSGGQKSQNSVRGGNSSGGSATKRYNCQSCPYSTDRRDLFTRHENIHKDEKPFHCYACLKQFNRADHVKKHFLRMHRELNYDINKTRKSQSSGSSVATAKATNYSVSGSSMQPQQHISEFLGARGGGNAETSATNGQNQQEMLPQNTAPEPDTTPEKMLVSETHVEKKMPMKSEKVSNSAVQAAKKKQGDKRYVCCYCPWTGADNWGLKRHLNTHTKPFVCIMCDYKAARSERLATHVFKVHNKKACNKCNFLADDQAQFMTHQTEVHPHDSRPARSGGGSASCTVLRSISNSFVQNTASQLTNNTNSTASGHTFCSLTHNSSVDNCGGATGSGYSSNNNQNLSDLGIQQWRSTNRSTNNSTTQKKGAERLFQYMEADGSDPEDYSRQLRMAALSRNTASVAQDFHNAGGGDKLIVPPSLAILGSLMEQFMMQQQQQVRWEESNGDGNEESHDQTCGDSSGAMSNSPPAITHYQTKKNRRRSCHDKENTNLIPHKCDKWDEMWMKEIIGMYQAHLSAMKRRSPKRRTTEEKRTRKQLQPRKIPQTDTTNVAKIRDKHLTRLVSRQKTCQICVYRHKCVVMPFHSKASLILHTLWRHSDRRFSCSTCHESFTKRYKLLLHHQITHKRRTFKLFKHARNT